MIGKNQSYIREINRKAILETLIAEDCSATMLARKLSLSNASLSTILGGLLRDGDNFLAVEVDNRRREVTIDVVDTGSRNILNNPVHAFDFLGSEYAASLAGEQEGRAVVRLTPAPGNTSSAGNIVLTVDTAAMRPVSLRYDYDGEQVQVSVLGIKPLETPLKAFAKDNYAGYEFIDFR